MHSPKLAALECGPTTEESASASMPAVLFLEQSRRTILCRIQESTLQMSPITATLGGIVNSQYLGLFKYLIYFVSLIFSF